MCVCFVYDFCFALVSGSAGAPAVTVPPLCVAQRTIGPIAAVPYTNSHERMVNVREFVINATKFTENKIEQIHRSANLLASGGRSRIKENVL